MRAALRDDTMTTAARKTNREASSQAYLLFTVRTSRKSFGVDFVRRKGQYLLISNRKSLDNNDRNQVEPAIRKTSCGLAHSFVPKWHSEEPFCHASVAEL